MNQSRNSLEQIFETHIQTLALTLRPGTVRHYRCTARRFLAHLRAAFPQFHCLSRLRRDLCCIDHYSLLFNMTPASRGAARRCKIF